ncbi:uncharacterized protein [Oryza sativa Japonica Group]|uniref:Transposon protein, putative, Mutator sub-class n=1 Tax=Oryza sativa subsp. japonica TaxID=39947 RepID=Q338R7_ORYSJ|nr:transposon protein, putative, Mutator sub-class [Oryza sativa Japonica Group]
MKVALEQIRGKFEESFQLLFNWKAEMEKSPSKKMCFKRIFVALKPCIDGFLAGCRPFIGVDATKLTERLVISADACKGLEKVVDASFPMPVEHRECIRHLYSNFLKKFHGTVITDHLYHVTKSYTKEGFKYHMGQIHVAKPEAIQFLEKHHSRIWYTCGFGEGNKCDYLTNNMSESINAKIRGLKELLPHELVDSIRDLIMEKMTTRREVAKNLGDEILMSVMKQLNDLTSLLKVVKVARSDDGFAEVTLVDADNMTRRHTVDLDNRKCSCRVWQVSGRVAPMTHRSQWPIVDLGFKVHALRQKSGARSPRVQRIRGCLEPGRKKVKCKRCHGFGHFQKTCKQARPGDEHDMGS